MNRCPLVLPVLTVAEISDEASTLAGDTPAGLGEGGVMQGAAVDTLTQWLLDQDIPARPEAGELIEYSGAGHLDGGGSCPGGTGLRGDPGTLARNGLHYAQL